MGFFNFATKLGRKTVTMFNHGISDIYNPIKQATHTLHKGVNFIDELLNRSTKFGVPQSVVDFIKSEPIFAGAKAGITAADEILSQDFPSLIGDVGGFLFPQARPAIELAKGIAGAQFIREPQGLRGAGGLSSSNRLIPPHSGFGRTQNRGPASFTRVPARASAF